MTVPFSTLTTLPLRTNAGDFDISNVVFDPETGSMPLFLVKMGGLLNASEALIRLSRVQGMHEDGASIATDLSENEVHGAPHITDATMPDVTGWPPLIVGPFGTTQSPLLLAAQLFGEPTIPETSLPKRFERGSDWVGASVFGPEGEFATIGDLHLDLAARTIREITLNVGDRTHIVPYTAIRNFVTDETYAVTDLTAQDLRLGITVAEEGPQPDPGPAHSWVSNPA